MVPNPRFPPRSSSRRIVRQARSETRATPNSRPRSTYLFGTQLGGGTDINRALAYCQQLITRPPSTILILVSDLFEGGDQEAMLRRVADLTAAGTQVIALLALCDDGAPGYDHEVAAALAELGVPAFACTPDSFGDLMAAAIERRDLAEWAHRQASSR